MTHPHDAVLMDDGQPTSARGYAWLLGGKDHYAPDRELAYAMLERYPALLAGARENRKFVGRVVRYLVEHAGVRQIIDLGCGYPIEPGVHQIAQQIAPGTRVVYVDLDPVVASHGRALLASEHVAMLAADIRNADAVFGSAEVTRLIDLDAPLGVLMCSVGHHLVDGDEPRRVIRSYLNATTDTAYLAYSQVCDENGNRGPVMSAHFQDAGIPWQTRTPQQIRELLKGIETVRPGLLGVRNWRPDLISPPLPSVPKPLRPYRIRSNQDPKIYEFGGLLRHP